MMIKIFQIENLIVSNVSFSPTNYICYNIKNSCFILDENFQKMEIEFSENYFGFIYGNFIWISNLTTTESVILDNKLQITKKLNYEGGFSSNYKNFKSDNFIYPLINFTKNYNNEKYSKINILNFEIENQYSFEIGFNGIKLIVNDNFFISNNNSDIGLFNFENENIWKINIKEILEDETVYLHNEILEINNKLFFIISGQEIGHFLYCVDIETGTILYKYEGLFGFLTKDDKYIYSQKFENILCKINTETGELEQWNVNDLLIENGFESIADHRTTALNEIVYFTQTIGDNKAKFGLLDTKKKQLIFKYNFEPKNGGIGKIEVNETRVYIHTQDNTLHIFEKEINEV